MVMRAIVMLQQRLSNLFANIYPNISLEIRTHRFVGIFFFFLALCSPTKRPSTTEYLILGRIEVLQLGR
jgi:hypothetical protein